jgi:hypothetical protein
MQCHCRLHHDLPLDTTLCRAYGHSNVSTAFAPAADFMLSLPSMTMLLLLLAK